MNEQKVLSEDEKKSLRREYDRKYHQANREKKSEYRREYYKANRERELDGQRKYYEANRDKRLEWHRENYKAKHDEILDSNRKYREENREKLRELHRNRRASNPVGVREYFRKYYASNHEKYRVSSHTRRARVVGSAGKLSPGLAKKLFKLQRGKCACCGKSLGADYHLDHIMPIALGGSNTDDNIQLLRATCNLKKSAKHPIDFMQSRGFLL